MTNKENVEKHKCSESGSSVVRPHPVPYKLADFKWLKKHGIKAWFTWATIEQAAEIIPLLWWQKLARKIF